MVLNVKRFNSLKVGSGVLLLMIFQSKQSKHDKKNLYCVNITIRLMDIHASMIPVQFATFSDVGYNLQFPLEFAGCMYF